MSPDLEERLRAAEADLEDLVDLGCELAEIGRSSDAEGCFRRASDLGSARASFNLGNCLAEQQRWLEAVVIYEIALDRGESDAWLNLGLVLHELGDLAGEIRAYHGAEAAGDSGGPLGLAFALREQGDRQAAMDADSAPPRPVTRPEPPCSPAGSGAHLSTSAWSPPCGLVLITSRLPVPIWGTCWSRQVASRRPETSWSWHEAR